VPRGNKTRGFVPPTQNIKWSGPTVISKIPPLGVLRASMAQIYKKRLINEKQLINKIHCVSMGVEHRAEKPPTF